jgi:peptidoglycan pentaglycine glycine transferase (the first glycine)
VTGHRVDEISVHRIGPSGASRPNRPEALSRSVHPDAPADWDAFVERAPGGNYRQSSAWAATKAHAGWEPRWVVIRRAGVLVAGAQLLVRPLPAIPGAGGLAHCAKGPLLADGDPQVAHALLEELRRRCRRDGVRALIVQPPEGGHSFGPLLHRAGAIASPIAVAPEATVLVDLTPDLVTVEQRLGKHLRKQLRRAERRGVTVRVGVRDDLPRFHELLTASSTRLSFPTFPLAYFQGLWDAFAAGDRVQLFLAEHEGRTLCASLCVVSADRIVSTAIGWSGEDGHLNPNDVLDWHTMRWAAEQGLAYFELENLTYDLACRLQAGADLADLEPRGSDRYKLKWSTEVVVAPRPQLYAVDPVARAALRCVPEGVRTGLLRTAVGRWRPMDGGST